MKAPLPPSIPFAFGAAIAVYIGPGAPSRLISVGAAAALLAVAAQLAVASCVHMSRPRPGSAALLVAASLGLLFGSLAHARVESFAGRTSAGLAWPHQVVAVDGRISADPRRTTSGLTGIAIELKVAHGRDGARVTASGPLLLYVRGGRPGMLMRGQLVSIALRKPAVPAVKAHIKSGGWAAALAAPAAFVDGRDVSILAPAPPPERLRQVVRSAMLATLNRAGGAAGPLLEALLVGVRDDLDGSVADDFRKAGCAHILALSGQHIGILATLVAVLLGLVVGPFRARAAACVLALAYLYIVGASPAVARAVLMFWMASAAMLLDRPHPPLAVLSLAFCSVVALDPASVHALSFKLSYLAVAGIALCSSSFEFRLRRWLPPPVSGAVAMGLAAIAFTAPLSITTFGTLNPFSPLTSALAGPLVSALMYSGLVAAVMVAAVPESAGITAMICGIPHALLTGTISIGAALPSITAEGTRAVALAGVVALGAAFVYAWPHAAERLRTRHRAAAGQLRLTDRPVSPAGAAGTGHAQEIRPKLPRQRTGQTPHRRAARGTARRPRVGNRPRNRVDDP